MTESCEICHESFDTVQMAHITVIVSALSRLTHDGMPPHLGPLFTDVLDFGWACQSCLRAYGDHFVMTFDGIQFGVDTYAATAGDN